MNNALVRFVSASVLGLTWVIIWQQILYAAYLPGEGFTASVLLTLVVMLQVAVLGREEAMRRLPPRAYFWALVAGLVLLLGVMAGPVLTGHGLLSVFTVPIGSYTLSSTTLFDMALFFVVSGSLLTALIRLPEPR